MRQKIKIKGHNGIENSEKKCAFYMKQQTKDLKHKTKSH